MLSRAYRVICHIPHDKILHFIVGQTIGFCLTSAGPVWMMIGALGVGIAKEVYDKLHPDHTFEWMDIVATALGGCYAALVAWLVMRHA